jgi:type II secretory pathway pseudopilin PulG
MMQDAPLETPGTAAKWVLLVLVALFLLGALTVGGCAGLKSYSRYQQRADFNQNRKQALYNEQNQVKVNAIRIAQTNQLVKVAQQSAQIRYENAVGVRKAQDEIAKTLTPLYVQFEMVQALQQIAQSGKNSSVVFIPTGPDGRPVVQPQMNALAPGK